MSIKYTGEITVSPFNVKYAEPADVRTVVEKVDDLMDSELLSIVYEGIVVYVVEDSSLYVCHTYPDPPELDAVEDGWNKIDTGVRIVENETDLTNGETIKFPYQGLMAYVTSEESLYVLLTKGANKAKDINNWRKISVSTPSTSTPLVDKIGIDVEPEGGTGFKISGNTGVVIDDYVGEENYIKSKYAYTSKGVNSFDPNPYFNESYVRLSKVGVEDAYIELYTDGENWIKIHNPNSLGLSVTVDGENYVSDTLIAKETPVIFGVDIKFHEGWTIAYGNSTQNFAIKDYELIDIYRSEYSPVVHVYRKDIDVRMLTEDDLVNMSNSILIDLDGDSDDSDNEEPKVLQDVIINMNNAITKLEQTKSEPTVIEDSIIDGLFS